MSKELKIVTRNSLILGGTVIGYVDVITSYYRDTGDLYLILAIISLWLTLWGCYMWTNMKNRHRAFMLWGLFSPIGLLGIALLKDKSSAEVPEAESTNSDGEQ